MADSPLPFPCGAITCNMNIHYCNTNLRPQCKLCAGVCAEIHWRGSTHLEEGCNMKCPVYMKLKQMAKHEETYPDAKPTTWHSQSTTTPGYTEHCPQGLYYYWIPAIAVGVFLILMLQLYQLYKSKNKKKTWDRGQSVESGSLSKPSTRSWCFCFPRNETEHAETVALNTHTIEDNVEDFSPNPIHSEPNSTQYSNTSMSPTPRMVSPQDPPASGTVQSDNRAVDGTPDDQLRSVPQYPGRSQHANRTPENTNQNAAVATRTQTRPKDHSTTPKQAFPAQTQLNGSDHGSTCTSSLNLITSPGHRTPQQPSSAVGYMSAQTSLGSPVQVT